MRVTNRRYIMEKAQHKSFSKPDEIRKFPKGRLEVVVDFQGMIDYAKTK